MPRGTSVQWADRDSEKKKKLSPEDEKKILDQIVSGLATAFSTTTMGIRMDVEKYIPLVNGEVAKHGKVTEKELSEVIDKHANVTALLKYGENVRNEVRTLLSTGFTEKIESLELSNEAIQQLQFYQKNIADRLKQSEKSSGLALALHGDMCDVIKSMEHKEVVPETMDVLLNMWQKDASINILRAAILGPSKIVGLVMKMNRIIKGGLAKKEDPSKEPEKIVEIEDDEEASKPDDLLEKYKKFGRSSEKPDVAMDDAAESSKKEDTTEGKASVDIFTIKNYYHVVQYTRPVEAQDYLKQLQAQLHGIQKPAKKSRSKSAKRGRSGPREKAAGSGERGRGASLKRAASNEKPEDTDEDGNEKKPKVKWTCYDHYEWWKRQCEQQSKAMREEGLSGGARTTFNRDQSARGSSWKWNGKPYERYNNRGGYRATSKQSRR